MEPSVGSDGGFQQGQANCPWWLRQMLDPTVACIIDGHQSTRVWPHLSVSAGLALRSNFTHTQRCLLLTHSLSSSPSSRVHQHIHTGNHKWCVNGNKHTWNASVLVYIAHIKRYFITTEHQDRTAPSLFSLCTAHNLHTKTILLIDWSSKTQIRQQAWTLLKTNKSCTRGAVICAGVWMICTARLPIWSGLYICTVGDTMKLPGCIDHITEEESKHEELTFFSLLKSPLVFVISRTHLPAAYIFPFSPLLYLSVNDQCGSWLVVLCICMFWYQYLCQWTIGCVIY